MADTFLAVFTGSKTSPRMQAWMAMPEAEQKAKMHKDILVFAGGPLGKTKKIGPDGIADISNNLSGFVLIRADSHHEAAKLFENHPHFAIFPGDTVEVMPVLPIPQG